MRVRVKICGIRTVEAAIVACDSGADFLGFNFVPGSKRKISREKAKEISAFVKGKIALVGVFQNQTIEEVGSIAKEVGLDFVQLHGQEDNPYIEKIQLPVIKSFTLHDNPENIQARYVMLDRVIQGQGDMVDLEKAAKIAQKFSLFLAGGLTTENVAEVVFKVKPYTVDVAGGIETNGVQDLEKIKLFIERAKKEKGIDPSTSLRMTSAIRKGNQ